MLTPLVGGAVTLEEAVQRALVGNPQVLEAGAIERAAREDVLEARSGYYPSLDVSGNVGREHSDIDTIRAAGGDSRTLTTSSFDVRGRQLLFDGFETRSTVERQQALSEAAAEDFLDVRETIAFQAVSVYLDVLRDEGLVKLADENVAFHVDTAQKVEERVSQGLSSVADSHQAQARLALARSTLTARRGDARESAVAYERVIGERPVGLVLPRPAAGSLLRDGMIDMDRLSTTIDESISEAVEQHPAVLRARAQLEAASAETRRVRSAYYPKLDLELNVTRGNNNSGVRGDRDLESLMVVGRWNLFRGGGDQARERASAARRAAAQSAVADTRRAIEERVATALQAKATSEEVLDYLKAHVESSSSTLENYLEQLRLGRRTLLDTLNAENELFNARSNLLRGEFNDLVNVYFVEASKGALVSSLGLAAP